MSFLFAAASSPSSEGEFALLFWAMTGGIVVFLGLSIERIADWMNERFLGGSYKPHKTLEENGWRILMLGILIEIAVAGWSANDAWQTRQIATKNNPLNQPIATISAMVWIVTDGTDRTGYTNLNNLKIGQMCVDLNENGGSPNNVQLAFGRRDRIKDPGFPTLCLASSWTQLGTDATGKACRFWHLEFREVAQCPPSQRELVQEAANWDVYVLRAYFLPPNSIVLDGNVTLTVNSITQPTISIHPQHARPESAHEDFVNNPSEGVTVFCQ